MNILLTNDDGYKADGINYLKEYFVKKKQHHVYIVAPSSEKSGTSHSITLRDSIRLVDEKENMWVIDGTPADCVIMALLGLVPHKIDVVLSGINHGPNIGRDIIYSGTCAAARQAGFSGVTSFALSMNAWKGKFYFENVGYFLDHYFDKLIQEDVENIFYNVNCPNIPLDEIKGVCQTIPCQKHYYQDDLVYFDSPLQGRYYWVHGNNPVYKYLNGTDTKALHDKLISVSPVKVFPEAADFNLKI